MDQNTDKPWEAEEFWWRMALQPASAPIPGNRSCGRFKLG